MPSLSPDREVSREVAQLRISRAAEVLRLEAKTIAHLEHTLDERFVRAIDLLLGCEGSVVTTGVGKAGLVGQKVSATLASTGTPSIYLHPTDAQHGDLGRIRARDVLFAFSNSGETAEVNALIGPVRRIGARVISMTGAPQSTLARHSDCVLDIGPIEEACPMNLAPTTSTSAMLALGDAVAMVVMQERAFRREDYALFHPAGSLGRKLMRVAEVMRRGDQLPLAASGSSIRKVLDVMNHTPGRPGAALITDGSGALIGIFTHGDLSRLLEKSDHLDLAAPVDTYMGKSPKSIGPEQLVQEAQRLMQDNRIDQIAVIDAARRAIGLLDVQDLLDIRF
ncbi:MAG: SIS domain-containing protein [Planctomycetota bacterium]